MRILLNELSYFLSFIEIFSNSHVRESFSHDLLKTHKISETVLNNRHNLLFPNILRLRFFFRGIDIKIGSLIHLDF